MTCPFTFTVFTPTYNRCHTLNRVYESLKIQTYQNFEWLIVDDGSTDQTSALIAKWQKDSNFFIRYFYQPNQGKHIAFNLGVKKAKGVFFLNLDSDDACEENALERFKYHWDQIPEEKKKQFSGVSCLCKTPEGNIIGSQFPLNPIDSNTLEITYRYKITGDKWGFHRTDVLAKFPFPEVKNAFFIPEGIVWSGIARKYQTRFINEPLLKVYYDDPKTSLSRNKNPVKHALGLGIWHKTILNKEIDFFWFYPWYFLRSAIHYSRFSLHSGVDLLTQFKELKRIMGKILYLITFYLGFLVYCWDYVFINKRTKTT
jgi:glycosyltransferase involved in cell wall biosynthesis